MEMNVKDVLEARCTVIFHDLKTGRVKSSALCDGGVLDRRHKPFELGRPKLKQIAHRPLWNDEEFARTEPILRHEDEHLAIFANL